MNHLMSMMCCIHFTMTIYYSYLNNPNSFPSTISKSKRPFGLAGSSPSSAVMVKMAPSEIASWNSVIIAEHPRFGVSFPDILDLNSLSLLVNTGVWSFTSVTLTTNWANVWRELPVVNPKNISRNQSLSGIFYIGIFWMYLKTFEKVTYQIGNYHKLRQ